MKLHPQASSSRRAGYSLAEVLIVVAIIATLYAVAATGAHKSWESQEVKSSAMRLAHDIALASHTAIKRNATIELRLYRFIDPAVALETAQYRAWQIVSRDAAGVITPVFEVEKFDGTTIMSRYGRFSSIVPPTGFGGDDSINPTLPIGPYEYVAIQFRPDGSTNLDPDAREPWTITLMPVRYADNVGIVPKVFQTIGIEPRTGGVRVWP